jgi:hypothetical protein
MERTPEKQRPNLDDSGTGAGGALRIYLDKDWERAFWSYKLGVPESQLPEAVDKLAEGVNQLPRVTVNPAKA